MSEKNLSEDSLKLLSAYREEATKGTDQKVNMWSVGEKLGLDRGQIQDRTMGLAALGLLEIMSLSGKILLTQEGLKFSQTHNSTNTSEKNPRFAQLIHDLEKAYPLIQSEIDNSEDFMIDISVLKAQAERSIKLDEVCSATLKAMLHSIKNLPGTSKELIQSISSLIEKSEV